MAAIPVIVKHSGKKYDVEVDTSQTGETFKYQLYSLTGVEPERQKIIVKGGQLKDETDMSKLGFKPGQQLMMMGTPSGAGTAFERPKEPTKFLEDMTEAEAAQSEGATPAGLQNLGNTCYLNSTLQTLRAIPELQTELMAYKPSTSSRDGSNLDLSQFGLGSLGSSTDLTASLRDLYKQMSETQDGVPPIMFLNAFRAAYPRFKELARDGRGYAQQDAEEAWSNIITSLKGKLVKPSSSGASEAQTTGFIDTYMGGRFEQHERCSDEAALAAGESSEPSRLKDETFYKLFCHVASKEINHLGEGIAAALTSTKTKTSPATNKEAEYTTTSRISRLPKYLPVHFVRFFWKRDVQKNAKILRKVTFPHELDVVEYCTDDLKAMLLPIRDRIRDLRKEELDVERARKRQKRMDKAAEDDAERVLKGKGPATEKDLVEEKRAQAAAGHGANPDAEMKDGTNNEEEHYKTDAEIEEERANQILTAKRAILDAVKPTLAEDAEANQTGLYELKAVVTHQGASADSGHYTAYVKKDKAIGGRNGVDTSSSSNRWWWFNDDRVTEVEEEKIDTLSGGGESHSALILLYRAVELPALTEEESRKVAAGSV